MTMPDLFGLTAGQFETFLLIFVRVSAILYLIPIFSAQQIPAIVRIALSLVVSFVLYGVVPAIPPLGGLGELTAAVVSQLLVGLVFGFVAFLVFTGIEFAGAILDIVVGFSAVNVINPLTSQSVSVIGEFELALGSLIYLAADAHHQAFEGMAGSFTLVPLPYAVLQPGLEHDVTSFFARALFMVFQIAGPVAIALFVTNIGLALMARVAPQLNIFAVGFPLQIGVGLGMILISLPLMGILLPQIFAETPRQFDAVLRQMRPPG